MQMTKKERDLTKFISDRALFLSRDASRLSDPAYTQAISRDEFTDEAMALASQIAELYVRGHELENGVSKNWGFQDAK